MSQRNLPPLEAGIAYRAREFEYLTFEAQMLHRGLTGEDIAILRLHLANATTLEIPISDADLQGHMRLLISAYPTEALEYVKSQPWFPSFLEEANREAGKA